MSFIVKNPIARRINKIFTSLFIVALMGYASYNIPWYSVKDRFYRTLSIGYYRINTSCKNCLYNIKVDIPKGVSKKGFKFLCSKCDRPLYWPKGEE